MPAGFLIVYSEPGKLVTLDEFQDWYNNEHVPLRMNHLHSFLTGARYSSTDSQVPSWVALYDIDDTATFQHESYTRLRANRSPREAELVKRLEILDRRTSEIFRDSGPSNVYSSLGSDNPTKWIITHGLGDSQDSAEEWTTNVVANLKAVDGWIRTRTFRCIDNLKTGVGVPEGPEAQKVPRYFAVHEFTSSGAFDARAVKSAIYDSLTSVQITEYRKWELYRAYPGIAQGNLGA